MALEGQIALWIIGHLPDSKLNAAGIGLVMPIAIFIEAPVIDLLSTGTTLGRNSGNLRSLTRFTLILMGWVALAHCLVVFTPLYDIFAVRFLSAELDVARVAREALVWMPLWAACVGWRRFRQGLLIRAGQTRPMAWGTFIRILAMALSALIFSATGWLEGLAIVGASMMVAVATEALYIHYASQPIAATLGPSDQPAISIPGLFRFHLPLTGSTMLMLTTPIFLTRAINGSPEPVLALAAFTTANTIAWTLRSLTFALPEAVISLFEKDRQGPLFWFCTQVGLFLSLTIFAMHIFGLDERLFRDLFRAAPGVPERAALAFLVMSPLPFLNAVMAYLRGVLTAHHVTSPRLYALGFALVGLLIALPLGVRLGWHGVVTAGVGLIVAHILEASSLAWSLHRWQKRVALA